MKKPLKTQTKTWKDHDLDLKQEDVAAKEGKD